MPGEDPHRPAILGRPVLVCAPERSVVSWPALQRICGRGGCWHLNDRSCFGDGPCALLVLVKPFEGRILVGTPRTREPSRCCAIVEILVHQFSVSTKSGHREICAANPAHETIRQSEQVELRVKGTALLTNAYLHEPSPVESPQTAGARQVVAHANNYPRLTTRSRSKIYEIVDAVVIRDPSNSNVHVRCE